MQVSVRFFGIFSDFAGVREVTLDLPDGATVEDALQAVANDRPRFAAVLPQVRAVVNGQNATRDQQLADGDDLSLLRAIGGG